MLTSDVVVGARVVLVRYIECYPRYQLDPVDLWTGTIASVDQANVWITLDRMYEGLEAWDNQIQVSREHDLIHQAEAYSDLRHPDEAVWARCDPRNVVAHDWDLATSYTTSFHHVVSQLSLAKSMLRTIEDGGTFDPAVWDAQLAAFDEAIRNNPVYRQD